MNCCKSLHHWRHAFRIAALLALQVLLAAGALAQSAASSKQKEAAPIENVTDLKGILILPRAEDVVPTGVTGIRGVVVKGPAFLKGPEFQKLLKWHLGFPLTEPELKQIQAEIVKYCREHDHLVVDVFTSEQDITDGIVQIAVIEAKVGKVTVANSNHRWFSDSIVLRDVGLKPGDTVLENRLNSGLAWANRNNYQSLGNDSFNGSFREVSANFRQGDLGKTDVELKVQDRFPLRVFVGADDTGIDVIGNYRAFAGFNWANVFGLDQRLNYEYIADTDFDKFQEHVASYVIPLPWHHEITFFGAYAHLNPDFSVLPLGLNNLRNKGDYYQGSVRYSIPLPQTRHYEQEITAGFDFKRTDTPLLFQGTGGGLLRTNNVDVAQFSLGYGGRLRDPYGSTALSLQGVYSPGGLTGHDNSGDYQDFAPGSNPEYLYGRLEIRRETLLPYGFSWYTRALGQYSDAKLVATEAFSLGGYDTVRGYDERVVSGDDGWLISNELRLPRLVLGNLTGREGMQDWIQPLLFCDYGVAINRGPLINQTYNETLLSVGVGFRYQVADNFRVRFDYGFQLDREYLNAPNAAFLVDPSNRRAHFGVELSF